jgi:hypothetical protein
MSLARTPRLESFGDAPWVADTTFVGKTVAVDVAEANLDTLLEEAA